MARVSKARSRRPAAHALSTPSTPDRNEQKSSGRRIFHVRPPARLDSLLGSLCVWSAAAQVQPQGACGAAPNWPPPPPPPPDAGSGADGLLGPAALAARLRVLLHLPVIVLPSPSLTPRRLLSRSAAGSVARPAVVLRLGALSLANRFSGGASRCAWQMRRQMRLADAPGFDEPADARWA